MEDVAIAMARSELKSMPGNEVDVATSTNQEIRRSLAVLVLVAVVPLLLLGSIVAWMLVQQREAAVEAELAGTARALQVAVDRELASQFSALVVLSTAATLERGDLPAFSERVRRVLQLHHDWLNAVLIDPHSHVIVASGQPIPSPAPLTASPDAVDEVVRSGRPKIVGIVTSGVITKQPFVQFLAPVTFDHEIRYVLSVVMNPATLSALFRDQGLSTRWTGAIVDAQMKLAGRSRDSERYLGMPATPSLVSRITGGQGGLFTALNQEGTKVYTAVSRSNTTGWTVAIGVPADEVEGPVRALLIKLVAGGGLLLALALTLTGLVGRSILRRRNAYERALRESRSRLDAALSGADIATWEMDIPSGKVISSDRWSDLLGYSEQELAPRFEHWQDLVHGDDRVRVLESLRLHLRGQMPTFEAECRIQHQDGRWLWVAVRGKVTEWDSAGLAIRAIGTALDVTQRKQAELTAERDRVRFQAILATASDGIHILNSDGLLVEANPAFLNMLGYDRSAVGVLQVSAWDPDVTTEQFRSNPDSVLATGIGRVFEMRHRRRDGKLIDVEVGAAPLVIDGQTYLCAASRDITERKRAEAELAGYRGHLEELVVARTLELAAAKDAAESANRAKSVFLANMSHELRTPINGMLGMAGLALSRATDPAQKDQLAKSMTAAKHLLAIINDILDLSKIEAEKLTLQYQNFRLSEVVADSLQLVVESVRAKGLALAHTTDPEIPDLLYGDGVRLTQILVNFLSNAVKFSQRGPIELRAMRVRDDALGLTLRFEVEDHGIGVSPADQDRLFQPFVQADATSTRAHGGTGLGLTICRRLARLMDGEVGVVSALGQGSTFWAEVRLDRGTATLPTVSAQDPLVVLRREFSGTAVLLADDNPVNREVAQALLEAAGLSVSAVEDGEQCVALARDGRHDLILMDIRMPGMDGIEATRAIRRLPGLADLPIIGLSASAFDEERGAALAAGMNGLLLKPVEPAVFYAKLLKWLTLRRP